MTERTVDVADPWGNVALPQSMALDKSTGSDGWLKCALTVANGFAPQPPHWKHVKVNKDQVTTSKLISKLTSVPNDNDLEKAPVNTSNNTAIVGISHAPIHHWAVCEKLLQGTLTRERLLSAKRFLE